MIYIDTFMGAEAVIMETDECRAIILPKFGGKVASLYNKDKDFELMYQSPRGYKAAALYDNFALYDCSGFDDAYPTIDECTVSVGGKDIVYPDHGEIWSGAFEYNIDGDCVVLTYESKILSYNYTKTFKLCNETLKCSYNISNSGESFPHLWAFHCLVNYSEDMEIIFPKGTTSMINVTNSTRLGECGAVHSFDGEYDFSKVPPKEPKSCEKYYVEGKVAKGECGYYYKAKDVTATICYDKEKLPYLGFWVTAGGFNNDYNCALEPCNGYYDSVLTAQKNSALDYLKRGDEFSFEIDITVR